MRAVFLFVVVASTSLALADPGPSSNAPAQGPAVVYRNVEKGEVPTTEPSQAAATKTVISITRDSFVVYHGGGEPNLDVAGAAVIVCDTFNAESVPNLLPKLHCQQCTVTLPDGSTASPVDVTYDTTTNTLTLTGADDPPVKLVSLAHGGSQRITAAKMVIELKFAPPTTPMPAVAGDSDLFGDPFAEGPLTTKPNPIHRLDKALIAD